jgi:hypothetical protein
MAREKLKAAVLFITILGIASGISWAMVHAQQTSHQQDQRNQMPELTILGQIRDEAMAYLQTNHPEAAQFMGNLNWTGGQEDTGLLGAETYTYQAQSWNVTIHYPVVASPVYNLKVDYSTASDEASIPHRVTWQGTWQDGCVAEASYVFAQ